MEIVRMEALLEHNVSAAQARLQSHRRGIFWLVSGQVIGGLGIITSAVINGIGLIRGGAMAAIIVVSALTLVLCAIWLTWWLDVHRRDRDFGAELQKARKKYRVFSVDPEEYIRTYSPKGE